MQLMAAGCRRERWSLWQKTFPRLPECLSDLRVVGVTRAQRWVDAKQVASTTTQKGSFDEISREESSRLMLEHYFLPWIKLDKTSVYGTKFDFIKSYKHAGILDNKALIYAFLIVNLCSWCFEH